MSLQRPYPPDVYTGDGGEGQRPRRPREDYFETLARGGQMSEEERDAFMRRHDPGQGRRLVRQRMGLLQPPHRPGPPDRQHPVGTGSSDVDGPPAVTRPIWYVEEAAMTEPKAPTPLGHHARADALVGRAPSLVVALHTSSAPGGQPARSVV